MQLTVHDVRALPDSRHTLVELSIKSNYPEPSPAGEHEAYNSIFQKANHQQLQIDVVDTHDHLVPWFQSLVDAESSRVTLNLSSPNPTVPPKELRYYLVTRSDVELPFEILRRADAVVGQGPKALAPSLSQRISARLSR